MKSRGWFCVAGVHDSYWTHASEVDQMNVIIRDKFVELHKRPLLEELVRDLQSISSDIRIPEVPKKGQLDLEDVRGSVYFFS